LPAPTDENNRLNNVGHPTYPSASRRQQNPNPAFAERRERWYELVDSDILTLIQDGRFESAQQRLAKISGIDTLATLTSA
jgi:hypothetical protein